MMKRIVQVTSSCRYICSDMKPVHLNVSSSRVHHQPMLFDAIYRNRKRLQKTNKYLSSLSCVCLSSWQWQLHLAYIFASGRQLTLKIQCLVLLQCTTWLFKSIRDIIPHLTGCFDIISKTNNFDQLKLYRNLWKSYPKVEVVGIAIRDANRRYYFLYLGLE